MCLPAEGVSSPEACEQVAVEPDCVSTYSRWEQLISVGSYVRQISTALQRADQIMANKNQSAGQ